MYAQQCKLRGESEGQLQTLGQVQKKNENIYQHKSHSVSNQGTFEGIFFVNSEEYNTRYVKIVFEYIFPHKEIGSLELSSA